MSDIGNREVFSANLKKYMAQKNVTRSDVCAALGFKYTTFTDWVNGNKYPRIDKIEMLANYFGIEKSDLIEDKSSQTRPTVSDDDIKFALFGGKVSDEAFEEVKRFAEFVAQREKKKES